ncbi:hypothetical protein [Salimicrobium halophilum]|uniref:Uncharacterized protein n=1 Tax=Salimicrobium halophilum TaxID=86666 RepID=A0A1G8VTG3_9BACI|nr:hypothetical protein [Salimicrobium halophilum]SDJ69143.1 hypothetical protein SAMN04490247_2883 [Salimicrobium halophilum]
MTLLYTKARELFEEDFKKTPVAKENAKPTSGVKQTRSGKLFRKPNKRK